MRAATLLASALAASVPATASACFDLGRGLWFCAAGSDWAMATREQGGDGSDLVLDEARLVVDFAYPGRATGSPGQDLDAYLAFHADPGIALTPVLRDRIDTADVGAERAVHLEQEAATTRAVARIVVETVAGTRLALVVAGEDGATAERIALLSRMAVTNLSLTCTGSAQCEEEG